MLRYHRCLVVILILASITSTAIKYKKQIPNVRHRGKVERLSIKFEDKDYIIVHDYGITKFNRTSPYLIHGNATIMKPWDKNIRVVIKSYELRNNQYKESFIRMDMDFCDYFEHNFFMLIARMYSNIPSKCPLIGNIYLGKLQIMDSDIPPGFPLGGWKFSFNFFLKNSKKLVFEFEAFCKVE